MSKAKPKDAQEVADYVNKQGYCLDPELFFDQMEMVGWVYGKQRHPVKDWKACVRTWNRYAENKKKDNGEGIRL